MRKGATAVAAVLIAAAALPATASARSYTAYAGDPSAKAPKGTPGGTTLNAFLPTKLKVRAGDKVKYTNFTFHTVSVLAKGAAPPPLAVPSTTETYTGILDPQGNPFFFNGRPKFQYNPAVFGPVNSGARGATVGDGKTHNSGAFGASPKGPGKYALKFSKPGTYTVLCLLHPGMKQTVTVLKRRARGADTAFKVRSAVTRQAAALYRGAKKAAKAKVPADTVYAGKDAKHATLLAFLPNSLKVARGTTVTFANMAPSEVHNMVWGPLEKGGFIETFTAATDLLPFGPGAPNQLSPPYVYGSEPATGPGTWTYSGTEYGNGFFWSPLMDDQRGDPPAGLPGVEKITFDTPGTYSYFCAIHGPDMSGTITVQ